VHFVFFLNTFPNLKHPISHSLNIPFMMCIMFYVVNNTSVSGDILIHIPFTNLNIIVTSENQSFKNSHRPFCVEFTVHVVHHIKYVVSTISYRYCLCEIYLYN